MNLYGYWSVRSFFNYGQPINFISSNLNLNGSVGYSRTPGMIDEEINYANNTNFRAGLNLSSNISEKIDFNISTSSSFNLVDNTLLTQQNNNYFNQSTQLRLNWCAYMRHLPTKDGMTSAPKSRFDFGFFASARRAAASTRTGSGS